MRNHRGIGKSRAYFVSSVPPTRRPDFDLGRAYCPIATRPCFVDPFQWLIFDRGPANRLAGGRAQYRTRRSRPWRPQPWERQPALSTCGRSHTIFYAPGTD